MDLDLLHPAQQIVMTMQRIYDYEMTTTSGGNLSILEDNGDIWITPRAFDKGALKLEDIVLVKAGGQVVGRHQPSVELPFHRQIYEKRPDIRAIVHAHPPALVAFSVARRLPDTTLLPNARLLCGAAAMAPYGLPGSQDLGEKVSGAFATGAATVILENHGAVVVGTDLFAAFGTFETLDFCARLEIDAGRLGTPSGLSAADLELAGHYHGVIEEEFTPASHSSEEREARRQICELVKRACDQKLFTATSGILSRRLSDGSFLVTPHRKDRRYLGANDLVRVEDGKREAGKVPSRSASLHHHLYQQHPRVQCIVVAQPPGIMAFAVTGQGFDTRIIPECYIMLRDVVRLPYGAQRRNPEQIAASLGPDRPLALVENDCVIVTGDSALQAFDRLEVAEYNARALIATRSIGRVVKIEDRCIEEIEHTFGLPPRAGRP